MVLCVMGNGRWLHPYLKKNLVRHRWLIRLIILLSTWSRISLDCHRRLWLVCRPLQGGWERKKLQVDYTGILKRVIQGPDASQRLHIVQPEQYRLLAMQELHSKVRHLGAERVTALIHEPSFWPCMAAEIERFINHVCPCTNHKFDEGQHPCNP